MDEKAPSNPLFDPDVSLIRAWSKALEKTMPYPAPYVAAFGRENKQLRYIAARHGGGITSPTLQTVKQAFDDFKPQVVILEGMPNEGVVSPAWYLEHTRKQAAGDFRQGGEGAYATVLAGERGIAFISAEPTEKQLLAGVLQQGFTREDMLGWYAGLMVHQNDRQGTLIAPEKIEKALNSYKRELGIEDVRFGMSELGAWYEQRMGRKFSLESLLADDMSPSGKAGANFLQKVMRATDNLREPSIVQNVAEQLEKYDRVLVVFGSSHLAKQEQVYAKMLGKPQYMKPF